LTLTLVIHGAARARLDANSLVLAGGTPLSIASHRGHCQAIREARGDSGEHNGTALTRPKVSFIAWAEDSGRAYEIAQALGGEACAFYRLRIVWKPLVPLRYLLNAIGTCGYLLSRRPRAVIVTNPPIFPGLIALLYCAVTKAPLVLDSHPSAFGDAPLAKQVAGIHAWLTRHAATTLVTVPELAKIVQAWGGQADIVHEASPAHRAAPASPLPGRPRIVYIGRFAGDEPTAEVIEAARLVPEVDVLITGDIRKCPALLRKSAPANVTFTGFLTGHDYTRALEQAAAIMVLTRHPLAVNRGAYEAVYFERPLIISNLPAMTSLFPYAISVGDDSASIARGIDLTIRRHRELLSACPQALGLQERRWQQQLDRLRELVSC
jgi:glycosyltransferase involved in cell wall biosynthesis